MKSKPGFDECIGTVRIVMRIIGLWPEFYEKKHFLLRMHVLLPFLMMVIFCTLPQLKALLIASDLDSLLDLLEITLIVVLISEIKIVEMWWNLSDFKQIIDNIDVDWKIATEAEQKIMWKNAKFSKLIVTFSVFWTIGICIFQMTRILLTYYLGLIYAPENVTIPKPLYMNSEFGFDVDYTPVNELLFISQFLACIVSAIVYPSYDGFFMLSSMHYSGQLYNLKYRIQHLADESQMESRSFLDRITYVIKRHLYICRSVEIIEKIFSHVFLLQVILMTILLCLQGYQFVDIISKTGTTLFYNLFFIIAYTCNSLISLFFYCYSAEKVRNESENLFTSVFQMRWYNLPPADVKMLLMVMNGTLRPIQLTLGKFSTLSLEYFTTILKTSMGYLTVLLAMKDSNK